MERGTDASSDLIEEFNSAIEEYHKAGQSERKTLDRIRAYVDHVLAKTSFKIDSIGKDLKNFGPGRHPPQLDPVYDECIELIKVKYHVWQFKERQFEGLLDDPSISDTAHLLKDRIVKKISDWWIYRQLKVVGVLGALAAATIGFYWAKVLEFFHSIFGLR